MDNHPSTPKRITGQVSWNKPGTQQSNASQPANEPAATGPLTGKELPSKPSRSSRSRKSATAFRTISEVADELDVQQHVLRFWETKFSQVKPLKRGGGRRYYRPEDLALLKKIHHLLYTEGYTIKGVQKLLKDNGKRALLDDAPSTVEVANTKAKDVGDGLSQSQRSLLESMLGDLKDLRKMVTSE